MSDSASVIALTTVSVISLFLTGLNYSFWRIHREDKAPLWLAGWLLASTGFTTARLLQYLPFSDTVYITVPRVLLTCGYILAWCGYELANVLTGYRPRRWERRLLAAAGVLMLVLIWTTDLVLTHSITVRSPAFGGEFHGVIAGRLYVAAMLVLLVYGILPVVRLLRPREQRAQNHLMALGYLVVLVCSMVDLATIALDLRWIRTTDFSYLPLGIFFAYIQLFRLGRIYRDLDATVHERTRELHEANVGLRAEVAERTQAQEALEVSEELYRMLFDANPNPGWVFDAGSLAFLLVNDAAVAHYGYSREEFLRMALEDIHPAEVVPTMRANLASQTDVLQWSGPWTHRKKDGTRIQVEILSHSLMFNGRPARLVMANDITQRVAAERAMQESEQKYRALVESSRDGVTIIQDGLVKYVNARLAGMFGDTVENILGTHFMRYVHPEQRPEVMERYARRQAGEPEPVTYETVLNRSDGTRVLAELTIGTIALQGSPAQIVLVRDITEQKRNEEALQRQLREMTVLNTVATAGSEAIRVDELIERVTGVVGRLLYSDNCGVLLADEHSRTWHPHPSYEGADPQFLGLTHTFEEGIAGRAIREGRIMLVGDVRLEPAYQETTDGILSEIAVPIIVNGHVFGCLNAESRQLNGFTERDERLISTIAGNMATAIEKIRLLQVEKRRREEAEILYNTTRDLVVERDLSELLRVIVERAAGMLGASSGLLDLCEPENKLVRCAVSYNTLRNYTGVAIPYGAGASGRVAESGQPLIVEDYRTWPGRAALFDDEQPFVSVLSQPMRWQGRVIGVIHVLDNTQVRSFTQEDVRMLDLFANQAAMAVENARLFNETSQRAQEAAVLAEVSRDISESLDLNVTLDRVVSYAKDLLRARTCAVYLPGPGGSTLHAIAAKGPFAEEIKNTPIEMGTGILASIAERRQGEIANNVGDDPRSIQIPGTEDLPVEHLMGVPVLTKDQLTGLIGIWRIGAGNEFHASELDFLTRLAGQVGVAIENARLFEGTRRRLREIEGLHVVSTALRSARTLEEALPIILEQLMSLLDAGGASLEMQDSNTGEIVTRLGSGAWAATTGLRSPAGAGVTGQVIASVQPYVSDDVVADGRTVRPELFAGLHAVACVPVIAQHQPIGVLWIGRRSPILPDEVNLLAAIGEMVGNAIHRMMLNEETVRRADEFEALYRSANGLSAQWDSQTVLRTVVNQARELLNSSGSDVYLYDAERNELRVAVETGRVQFMGTRLRMDEGLAGRVFREQRPIIVDNYQTWEGRSSKYDDLPLGAVVEVPITFAGERLGVLSAYETADSNRKYTEGDARLLSLFANQAASSIRTARLLAELRGATHDLSLAYDTTLEGWAKALELRDKETLGHSRRVSELTLGLARRLGVPEAELTHIRRGVLLHDIGKMGIPDNLLKKTGPLNEEEWVEMRKHPKYAYDLLHPIAYLRPALDIPYCHHEQWDGSGYPRGLKGKQIPLAARIFTVVDVFDALSYDRPYRAAWPRRKVIEYIEEQSGKLFDPDIVQAFLELLYEKKLSSSVHPEAA